MKRLLACYASCPMIFARMRGWRLATVGKCGRLDHIRFALSLDNLALQKVRQFIIDAVFVSPRHATITQSYAASLLNHMLELDGSKKAFRAHSFITTRVLILLVLSSAWATRSDKENQQPGWSKTLDDISIHGQTIRLAIPRVVASLCRSHPCMISKQTRLVRMRTAKIPPSSFIESPLAYFLPNSRHHFPNSSPLFTSWVSGVLLN
jgi:hypothetical protein